MWCVQCQQDVPGIAAGEAGTLSCLRCGGELHTPNSAGEACGRTVEASPKRDRGESADGDAAATPPRYDTWEVDQQLQYIERVLDAGKTANRQAQAAYQQEVARLDPPHTNSGPPHLPRLGKPGRTPKSNPSHPVLAALTWSVLSLGTMALVCGGVLLGWSLVSQRTELWNVGMPVALCGQIALLLGLVLQLDRLWHDSRRAAVKLDDVDERLHELNTTTTMLTTGNHSPGSAFYSHLAGGAGPELLLSDLKGQLDLLAVKIAQSTDS